MARATNAQSVTIAGLRELHGIPDQISIERTAKTEANIRCVWWEQKRCLTVAPNGLRVFYEGFKRV